MKRFGRSVRTSGVDVNDYLWGRNRLRPLDRKLSGPQSCGGEGRILVLPLIQPRSATHGQFVVAKRVKLYLAVVSGTTLTLCSSQSQCNMMAGCFISRLVTLFADVRMLVDCSW